MSLPRIFDDTSIADGPSAVGAVVLVAARAVASLGKFTVRGIVRKPSRTTRAGFVYFDLEDESGARLRCRAAGIEIASGALTVRGDLSVFVGTGDLQFNVVEIVP